MRRLNRESGTTVFLTTQYLEEADQLAGRVGIIDGGRIVAEGTPAELKAEVGDPTLTRDARRSRAARGGARGARAASGAPLPAGDGHLSRAPARGRRRRCRRGARAGRGGRRGAPGSTWRSPRLDDVFVAQTGRRLEAEGAEEAAAAAVAP